MLIQSRGIKKSGGDRQEGLLPLLRSKDRGFLRRGDSLSASRKQNKIRGAPGKLSRDPREDSRSRIVEGIQGESVKAFP